MDAEVSVGPVGVLRFLAELATLASVAVWGGTRVAGLLPSVGLAAVLVVAVAGFWGLLVAPTASRRLDPPLRQVAEAVAFGTGVVALADLGRPLFAGVLAGAAMVSIVGTARLDAA